MVKKHAKKANAFSEKPDLPVEVEREQPETEYEESEDVSESEANAMVERVVEKQTKQEAKEIEAVDRQDWTRNDPVIPEGLKGKVWIAVFRCPKGHKTKATNRQAEAGVLCYPCKVEGKQVKAEVMDQFVKKPAPADETTEKRKKAKRNSQ